MEGPRKETRRNNENAGRRESKQQKATGGLVFLLLSLSLLLLLALVATPFGLLSTRFSRLAGEGGKKGEKKSLLARSCKILWNVFDVFLLAFVFVGKLIF